MKATVVSLLWMIIISAYSATYGQYDVLHRTHRLLHKGKYRQSLELIRKSILKDSTNTVSYQALAAYYAFESNPAYALDSAHFFNTTATHHFRRAEEKSLQKLSKKGIDAVYLRQFAQQIDSLAFEEAKSNHVLSAYTDYIAVYTTSSLLDSAIYFRNLLAFDHALLENTYHSYRSFMEKYPEAPQFPEAKARFEKLYYDESVKDGKLSSYIRFLDDHPQSIYRSAAEFQILRLSTIHNRYEQYIDFINKYPMSPHTKVALDYAYHLSDVLPHSDGYHRKVYDSLETVRRISAESIFPIYNNGFGFINSSGKVIIPIPYSPQERSTSRLGGLFEEFLWLKNTKDQLLTKSGEVFWSGSIDTLKILGAGLLHLIKDNNHGVIHFSGREVVPFVYQQISLINDKYIAYLQHGKWGILSALGVVLTPPLFDQIVGFQKFILFRNDKKWAVSIADDIDRSFKALFLYDDYEIYDDRHLMVFHENQSNVLSDVLEDKLPRSTTSIKLNGKALLTKDDDGYHMIETSNWSKLITSDSTIKTNLSGVYYHMDSSWYSRKCGEQSVLQCDSITTLGENFVLYYKGDSIGFTIDKLRKYHHGTPYRVLRYENESYIKVTGPKQIELIDENGSIIPLGRYKDVSLLGDSLFAVEYRGLKGIIDRKGNLLTKVVYDAIQRSDSLSITLLKQGKFGFLHSKNFSIVTPQYEQKVRAYNDSLFIVKKGGLLGLINSQNKTKVSPSYDMIYYWNDSSALVKKGYEWMIQGVKRDSTLMGQINQFSIMSSSADTQLIRIFKGSGFGLLHSKKGVVIPPGFSNIRLLKVGQHELYVAEKYIEEADFYVILYYTPDGKLIYKHAMDGKNYQSMEYSN